MVDLDCLLYGFGLKPVPVSVTDMVEMKFRADDIRGYPGGKDPPKDRVPGESGSAGGGDFTVSAGSAEAAAEAAGGFGSDPAAAAVGGSGAAGRKAFSGWFR